MNRFNLNDYISRQILPKCLLLSCYLLTLLQYFSVEIPYQPRGAFYWASIAFSMSCCCVRFPTIKPCKRSCLMSALTIETSPPKPVRMPITEMCALPHGLPSWIDLMLPVHPLPQCGQRRVRR